MNLPSLIHYQSQSQPSQPHSPYSQSMPTTLQIHTQLHEHQRSLHYSSQTYSPQQHSRFTSHPPPVPPPSPPVEENTKCQLPSISTLLNYADIANSNERHPHESSPLSATQSQPRVKLPPTPPMRPDSVFEAASPLSSTTSSPQFYHPQTQPGNRQSFPPALKPSHYAPHPDYHHSQTYYSQSQSTYKVTPPSSTPTSSNPWQHHHHSAPASQAAFPQSQDRYICPTCNKAFSRPSSLRIHSHSHTGEKPFKCPQPGCGKAFSVRSNMKRHERGCHQ